MPHNYQIFTFYQYLVDEFGDFITTQSNERIIVQTFTVEIDAGYRSIGGQLGKRCSPPKSCYIGRDSNDEWYLTINKQTFVGRYPTQADAISVLYGIHTYHSGRDDGFAFWIEESLALGHSIIEPAFNYIQFATDATETSVSVTDYDPAMALSESGAPNADGGYWLGYQTSADGITWNAVTVANVIGATLTGDTNQTRLSTGSTVWDQIAENEYYRGVLLVADAGANFYVGAFSRLGLKDEVDETDLTGLTMTVDGSTTEGDPVYSGSYAHANVDESGAVLDPEETISYTYSWYREIPTMTGLTVS